MPAAFDSLWENIWPMSASPEGELLLFELGILIVRSRRLVWTAAAREVVRSRYSTSRVAAEHARLMTELLNK